LLVDPAVLSGIATPENRRLVLPDAQEQVGGWFHQGKLLGA
jgi:hypothetical protein